MADTPLTNQKTPSITPMVTGDPYQLASDRSLMRKLCDRDRTRRIIERLCATSHVAVRVTAADGFVLLEEGPVEEVSVQKAGWSATPVRLKHRSVAQVEVADPSGDGLEKATLTALWLEDLIKLEDEVGSLTEEVVHSYEELHLLYSLGGALGEVLEVSAACPLIVETILQPLDAWRVTLYLGPPDNEGVVAEAINPKGLATFSNAQARAEASLQVNAAPIGRIVVEGKLSGTEFSSGDLKLLDGVASVAAPAIRTAQLYEAARQQADTDGLTGIANHRRIHECVDQSLHKARREGRALSLIICDLDNFKQFNDLYGHPVGDRVLRTVTQCLRRSVRGSDLLGRYGGDEFLLVLPDTDAEGAIEVARRILEEIGTQSVEAKGQKLPLAVSIGIASYPEDAATKHELIAHADTALYESKSSGGHTVSRAFGLRSDWLALQGHTYGVLEGLVQAVDAKDHYTREHSEAVTDATLMLARELNLSDETQRALRIAGLLHDVGKIGIPDSVLKKPGRLTDEEYRVMQQHVRLSEMIIKDVPYLNDVLDAVGHHHEWYDGRGYPYGKKGEEIPLLGRIMAIADAYTAMCLDRPYRKRLNWEEIRRELKDGAGTQFDPKLVRVFIDVLDRMPAPDAVEPQE